MKLWASLMLALAVGLAAVPASAFQTEPEPEILVVGLQPGPKLWLVEREDAEVWILGINRFLPRGVEWDESRVAAILGRADALYTPVEVEVSPFRVIDLLFTDTDLFLLPKRQRLADVLPAEEYARFSAARKRLGLKPDAYERLRPAYAAGALLGEAIKKADLDEGRAPEKKVFKLARRRGLKPQALRVYKGKQAFAALEQVSAAAQLACASALLRVVDNGMPALERYAKAWAVGDVAYMRAHPPPQEFKRCEGELLASVDFARQARSEVLASEIAAIDKGLAKPGARLLVVDIAEAIEPDGLVATLRARGYAVAGP